MARMSIDDKVSRDPRITMLAELLGWSRREVLGCLIMDVWPVCYDQETHLVSERLIDVSAKHPGFAAAMIDCELAARDRSGKVLVRGAKERVAYLNRKREAGREGGVKSAESRGSIPKHPVKHTSSTGGSTPQAPGNPIPTVPDTASASVSDPAWVEDQEKNSARPPAGGSRPRKSKPTEPTAAEVAVVATVLERLGKHTGTRYSGASEHTRLIVARLRDGLVEMDLRKVIAYCALGSGLGWAEKPEMFPYLRPETLFGPKTIAKYLDPARSWFAKEFPDAEEQSA